MHPNSYNLMQGFRDKYLPADLTGVSVLDVGAMDLNGCYRAIFEGAAYVGLDMEPGPNVDAVMGQPHPDFAMDDHGGFTAIPPFDVVISGQTLEHCPRPLDVVQDMSRSLQTGGLICCIAPWQWCFHEHPVDCWRILPDGMRALYEDAWLEVLECYMSEWDTIGIGRKP